MSKRKFSVALRQLDGQLEAALSPAADARLRSALTGAPAPSRLSWALAPVAVCAAVLLVWSLAAVDRPVIVAGLEITKVSAPLKVSEGAGRTVTIEAGRADVKHPSFEGVAEVSGRASFLRVEDALRLVEGRATFVVGKRGAKGPVRILVSHGAIEIVGTRFTVSQGRGEGWVELHEGVVRFVPLHGPARLLQPGERLGWREEQPTPVAPKVEPAAAVPPVRKPAPAAAVPSPIRTREEEQIDSNALLQAIDMMRSRGQFREAATKLEAALDVGYRPVTRERFSYELGSIYTRQLADLARACAHWRAHAVTYPSGRYDQEVTAAQAELGCPAVP